MRSNLGLAGEVSTPILS